MLFLISLTTAVQSLHLGSGTFNEDDGKWYARTAIEIVKEMQNECNDEALHDICEKVMEEIDHDGGNFGDDELSELFKPKLKELGLSMYKVDLLKFDTMIQADFDGHPIKHTYMVLSDLLKMHKEFNIFKTDSEDVVDNKYNEQLLKLFESLEESKEDQEWNTYQALYSGRTVNGYGLPILKFRRHFSQAAFKLDIPYEKFEAQKEQFDKNFQKAAETLIERNKKSDASKFGVLAVFALLAIF